MIEYNYISKLHLAIDIVVMYRAWNTSLPADKLVRRLTIWIL